MSAVDIVNAQIAIIDQFEAATRSPDGSEGRPGGPDAWMLADKADAASLAVKVTKALLEAGYTIVQASDGR